MQKPGKTMGSWDSKIHLDKRVESIRFFERSDTGKYTVKTSAVTIKHKKFCWTNTQPIVNSLFINKLERICKNIKNNQIIS